MKYSTDSVGLRNYGVVDEQDYESGKRYRFIWTRYNIQRENGTWTSVTFKNEIPNDL